MQHVDKNEPAQVTGNLPATQNFELRAGDSVLKELPFKAYVSTVERKIIPLTPGQTTVVTPGGSTLNVTDNDLVLAEVANPDKQSVIKKEIFANTYKAVEGKDGVFIKSAVSHLAPGVSLTNNPDAEITFHTLEGETKRRAGDCFIAVGSKGEVYPISKSTVERTFKPEE